MIEQSKPSDCCGARHQSHASLRLLSLVFLLFAIVTTSATGQSLQINYGAKGIQTLTYAGVPLEDIGLYPGDAFHIWHSKSTDLAGNVIPGWGENNSGESWNAATLTETYYYQWGTIATRFAQQANTLNIIVTETNYAGSGTNFDGAEIYPFTLHFPQDPVGFSGYSQYAITTTGPGVSAADFGQGIVTAVLPDESIPMYVGWKTAGTNTYSPLMTTTPPDGLATFYPQQDYPVAPGTSFTYTLSYRFTAEGVPADATDAYSSFSAKYPSQMTWTDKRIIGTVFLASSPATSNAGGFPTNPRHYFNDPTIDITSASGLRAFQNRMLAQAANIVTTSAALSAQGAITWDIEGEQYPQMTSYVCSPDQIAATAPEMESTITDPSSAYFGKKLDDAYFQTISSAGLRIGLCLRPQVFTLASGGTASQVYLTGNTAIIANLEAKARYANTRWGATIFYVDSTVDVNGGTLDPAIFQQIITDLPGFLFIPEESTPRYYAYTAPFYSFIFHTTVGTPSSIYKIYPHAFGANLVNDVAASTLAAYQPQLTQAVVAGDILMGHADYWQANDPTLVAIYQAAGRPPLAPVQVTPVITWAQPSSITFGTTLTAVQLNATASTAGVFTYAPGVGAVLPAGTSTLLATFTPTDVRDYTTATSSVSLAVTKATPVVTWSNPSPITSGAALSSSQLNATANVPGTFTYTPAAGTVLAAGVSTLQVAFTPADYTDYNAASTSTSITVLPQQVTKPSLLWPTPAAIPYGSPLGALQLNATANVPGTFQYSPGAGTVPQAGSQALTVTFTPGDSVHYAVASSSTTLVVTPALPAIAWATPASIPYGTALGVTQLNAAANIPGSFSYSPSAGSVLPVGTQLLIATFTPSDNRDYTTTQQTVVLNVTAVAATSNAPLYILSPVSGAVVSGSIIITAHCSLALDSAGTYLIADGVPVPGFRVTQGPFVYPLDTTTLTNGTHTIQIWGHDIGNNVTLSQPITIKVIN